MFQSTPPRGGRLWRPVILQADNGFNPRPRAGGDEACWSPETGRTGFNPRPRAGGDFDDYELYYDDVVSIHAPARGATKSGGEYGSRYVVSIHAPARGATRAQGCNDCHHCFNPRPRAGGDAIEQDFHLPIPVSIHAPARGATPPASTTPTTCKRVFQSTPPRGGRLVTYVPAAPTWVFQSTPPRGGRPTWRAMQDRLPCFNPRPRAGGDFIMRDATYLKSRSSFNPRPRAGGDPRNRSNGQRQIAVSIHAPARGATPYAPHVAYANGFQSTPPRGGRPYHKEHWYLYSR